MEDASIWSNHLTRHSFATIGLYKRPWFDSWASSTSRSFCTVCKKIIDIDLTTCDDRRADFELWVCVDRKCQRPSQSLLVRPWSALILSFAYEDITSLIYVTILGCCSGFLYLFVGEVSAEEPQQQATEATKGPPSSYASAAHRAIQPEDSYNKR